MTEHVDFIESAKENHYTNKQQQQKNLVMNRNLFSRVSILYYFKYPVFYKKIETCNKQKVWPIHKKERKHVANKNHFFGKLGAELTRQIF